uniref:Solute carrier family 47 member 3 n=1 Tax=Salmo trutta TaxID=8032 RepID=A0A674CNB2_SALTR
IDSSTAYSLHICLIVCTTTSTDLSNVVDVFYSYQVMAQLMVFLVSFVSTIFCGHLGKTELAGVTLAIAVINVTGVSIGYGLSSVCDTHISNELDYCSLQTFGSHNLLKVGVIVQRAILIQHLACFPCCAVLINTEPILLAVKQSPEVATFIFQLEARYLQNQGIIWLQVITDVVANVLNALINIFLYRESSLSLAAILYAYILWKELHKATWECKEDWGTYIHLWWTYELGGFLAGLISEVELGAQSVVFELASICYMFPLGFSVAGSVRVGSALGAGDTEQAKLSAKLSAKLAMFCAGTCACQTPQIIFKSLTTANKIRERVAQVMAFYAPFLLLYAILAASGRIIRGAGKQKVGAICNILGYYGVGFSIGVSLMFAACGPVCLPVFLQSSFLIVYLSRMNWKKATVEVNTGKTLKSLFNLM